MHNLLACIHVIENKCKNQNMLGLIKVRMPRSWSGFIKVRMRPRPWSGLINVQMLRPWFGLIKVQMLRPWFGLIKVQMLRPWFGLIKVRMSRLWFNCMYIKDKNFTQPFCLKSIRLTSGSNDSSISLLIFRTVYARYFIILPRLVLSHFLRDGWRAAFTAERLSVKSVDE